ncbi:MAG TPA: kelch repeat-containing protein [Acidimicrobiales bacterium]|nr:kelch repeat-containing protein [Acidimicrobiales bacterium]
MDTTTCSRSDLFRSRHLLRRWGSALWLVPLMLGVGATTPVQAASASGGSWASAGQLSVPRSETSVTLLSDGKVLVAGGANPPEASAEVFDPATKRWSPTGALGTARAAHAAVRLADGKVLVSGGRVGPDALNSTEIYDPTARTWAATGAMAFARQAHTATLLADGKVLVAGGLGGGHGPYRVETEVFDPATGTWSATGALPQGRARHSATPLNDGRVLVIGGEGAPHDDSLRDAALYDPASRAWSPLPRLLGVGRADHTATALPNGTVMVVGGTKVHTGGRPQNIVSTAEILDQAGQAFLPGPAMAQRRSFHAATALAGGRVLVTGGNGDRIATPTATAEIYDPATRQWATVSPMPDPAASHTAVVLAGRGCGSACGQVLVVAERAAYLFTPPPPGSPGSKGANRNLLLGAVGAGAAVAAAGLIVARRRHISPTTSRRGTDQTMEHR